MDGLDDFLTDANPAAETQPEAQPEPEAEAKAERPRDEQGRFAPKAETGVEPEPGEPEPEAVPPTEAKDKLPKEEFAGLKDERRKRQEAEQRLEALERQLQQLQAKPQEPPAPPPSLWDDEDGWQRNLQQQVLTQADRLSRINASEMAARVKYDDFDDMFSRFNEMAAQNPALVQQTMDSSGTPSWLKAYDIAKKAARVEELGAVDLTDLEAKLREQIKAEMEAQKPAALPNSLSDQQSARNNSAQPFTPPSLDDILRRK